MGEKHSCNHTAIVCSKESLFLIQPSFLRWSIAILEAGKKQKPPQHDWRGGEGKTDGLWQASAVEHCHLLDAVRGRDEGCPLPGTGSALTCPPPRSCQQGTGSHAHSASGLLQRRAGCRAAWGNRLQLMPYRCMHLTFC